MQPSPRAPVFEACVDSVASTTAALAGGAGRLELCSSLVEGGVTPSAGLIRAVAQLAAARTPRVPVHVLIRPRAGDFCYTPPDLAVMEEDVRVAAQCGAAGVVLGVLTPEGRVDRAACARLIAVARSASLVVTFHRACDAADDPVRVAVEACELGAQYVLSSGGAAAAIDGVSVLRAMVEAVAPLGATVIAGGGVTPSNAGALASALGSRADVHGTARRRIEGRSVYRKDPPVYMGAPRANDADAEYSGREACTEDVAAIVGAIGSARR